MLSPAVTIGVLPAPSWSMTSQGGCNMIGSSTLFNKFIYNFIFCRICELIDVLKIVMTCFIHVLFCLSNVLT